MSRTPVAEVFEGRGTKIGSATDAQIWKFAVDTSLSDKEIIRTDRELRKIRDQAQKAQKEVKAAKAGQKSLLFGGVFRASKSGSLTFGKEGQGQLNARLGPSGFTIGGGLAKSMMGMYLIMGTANAAESLQDAYFNYRRTHALLGRKEAQARLGATVVRGALGFVTGGEGGRAIARLVAGAVLGQSREETDSEIDEFFRSITTTARQKSERFQKAKELRASVEEAANAYVNQEIEFIDKWRPSNVQLKSSEDVAALKRSMWDRNGGAVKEDVKRNRAELEQRLKQELAKD